MKDIKKETMKIFIWEDVDVMSERYHSDGGVIVIAKNLKRAREIAKEHDDDYEVIDSNDTTIFNTKPNKVLKVGAKREYYCSFPDAGCC